MALFVILLSLPIFFLYSNRSTISIIAETYNELQSRDCHSGKFSRILYIPLVFTEDNISFAYNTPTLYTSTIHLLPKACHHDN